MYQDDYGREWEGPFPFSLSMISAHAPRATGVYQLIFPNGGVFEVAYIGIATGGNSIYNRLTAHCTGSGNWALARLSDPDSFLFVCYRCDDLTAKQIESHVITLKKPPFNVKPEYKHFIPSISIH
jgi:excinuclease UvrABC nuclease subunit